MRIASKRKRGRRYEANNYLDINILIYLILSMIFIVNTIGQTFGIQTAFIKE